MRYSASDSAAATPVAGGPRETWLELVSVYAVILSGAYLLAIAEQTLAYALLASVLCVGHAVVVGPAGAPPLPKSLGKLLAIAALGMGLLQAHMAHIDLSYGLAHFLIMIQIITLYGSREPRDVRLIQVAALFQAMVAGTWALAVVYLPAFLVTAVCLMSSLLLATLRPGDDSPGRRDTLLPSTVNVRYLVRALWVPGLLVFGLSVCIFVVLPREQTFSRPYSVISQQMTGFADNVSLHDVGRMRDSENEVLRVRFSDYASETQAPVVPEHMLMRGVSLPTYEDGQWLNYTSAKSRAWRRYRALPSGPAVDFADRDIYYLRGTGVPFRQIHQQVTMVSVPGRMIFALYRPIRVLGDMSREIEPLTHEIGATDITTGSKYEVVSIVPRFRAADLRRAGTPAPTRLYRYFWDIPRDLRTTLEDVAAEIDEVYGAKTDFDRALAVQEYLLDASRFSYTYDLPDFGLMEPLGAFLTKTKRGSCEQFSSAMALLLRVWDIPTRLVVGFKGGDFDPTDGCYVFRDKHAHAWVEVYFNGFGWVEFDPTPASAVERPGVRGMFGALDSLGQRLRRSILMGYRNASAQWGGSVIGYSRKEQQRIMQGLADAAAGLASRASHIFRSVWPGMPDLGAVEVGLMVVVLTLAVMGVYVGANWLQGRLGWLTPQGRVAASTVRFYRDLLRILGRKGLRMPPGVTPREFAGLAGAALAAAEKQRDGVSHAVRRVTEHYYRVRFGGYGLSASEMEEIREALRLLRRAKRARAEGWVLRGAEMGT